MNFKSQEVWAAFSHDIQLYSQVSMLKKSKYSGFMICRPYFICQINLLSDELEFHPVWTNIEWIHGNLTI